MQMEAGLDTGPVLLRRAIAIEARETAGELHDRLSALGAAAIVDALAGIEGCAPETQPTEGVTYAAKIDKAEARIDWTKEAAQLARDINGLSPFPGAWTLAQGKRLKMLRAGAVEGSGAPGVVLGADDVLTVAAGSGAVEITECQGEGRGRQDVASYLRGNPIAIGTKLGET